MKSLGFSMVASVVLLTVAPAFAQNTNRIDIWDYCDPVSFAVLGPDTCQRDTSTGAITFDGFGTELGLDQSVGAWRFAPENLKAKKGVTLTLVNRGGETHTFTEVKHFGGGFVAPLNAASGNPVPAPECAQIVNGNLMPQPPSDENIFMPAGATVQGPTVESRKQELYQCCIHPWMRTVINPHAAVVDDHDKEHHGHD
jgi:hypothetical protein